MRYLFGVGSMISEFIDAYSDDQLYLQMLEELVNSHPSESTVPSGIKYSSFCRLWAVMMVGGVECMIKEWAGDKTGLSDIYSYFERASNAQRLERLQKAFLKRRIEVDPQRFEDFLAVKYIRNAYVHGEWNEEQRTYVTQRGFPKTLMSFDAEDFMRMKESYDHVMKCLGMAKVHNDLGL